MRATDMQRTIIRWSLYALAWLTVAASAALIAMPARAAPFAHGDPVPIDFSGPSKIEQSADDGANYKTAGCVWANSASTKTFFCDLAGTDTSPGTRKLRFRYTYVAACDPSGLGPCVPGGLADAPFSLTWLPTPAPTGLAVVPTAP